MNTALLKKLDVGCGRHKVEGTIGMDIDPQSNADIIHDLNKYPYPVEDNSFDEIYAKHIIEHLQDPQKFMAELWRIVRPGGRVFVETPHFTSYMCYSEPQHNRYFSYFMLINIIRPLKYKIKNYQITFYKTFRLFGIKVLANKWPEAYERFWTYIFPAENLVMELEKDSL